MANTLLLDQGLDSEGNEIIVTSTPFYKPNNTGVADSIHAVQASGLVQAPTYLLVNGRGMADAEDLVWSQWNDTFGERLTVKDKKGILGSNGAIYVVDIQNGGLFAGKPEKIRAAVQRRDLINNAMPLNQREVNEMFDAIKRGDVEYAKQKGWTSADNVHMFTDFGSFRGSSSEETFLRDNPAYFVVRKVEDAQVNNSGYQNLENQRNNPDLIIPSGGVAPLGKMLDKAEEFGWTQFGSHHDGYKGVNSGRLVVLNNHNNGVNANNNMNNNGRSSGIFQLLQLGHLQFNGVKNMYEKIIQKFIKKTV